MKSQKIAAALAFGLALAGVILIYRHQKRLEIKQGAMISIIVANGSISAGKEFSNDNIASWKIPKRYMPGLAVKSSEFQSVLGRKSTVNLEKGQPVLWNFVDAGLDANRLSNLVKVGERAYTMRVDELSSYSGMLRVGDRVDILYTFTMPAGRDQGKTITKNLLQNVTIISIGDKFGPQGYEGTGSFSTISISVTPKEAELLTFAETMGNMRLILRNMEDINIIEEESAVDFLNLFGIGEKLNELKKKNVKTVPKISYQ